MTRSVKILLALTTFFAAVPFGGYPFGDARTRGEDARDTSHISERCQGAA